MLGLVRAAPDRRHRVPWGHRPRRRAHRGGGRHRTGRVARPRCRVHRLGDRCHAGRQGARRAACVWSAATRPSGAPRSRSTCGPDGCPGRVGGDDLADRRRRCAREALPRPRGDERHRRAARQGVVLGARGGRDPRRPLHRVRDLRCRVPLELHRDRRGHQSARTGQDVHRVFAVLGLLPTRRPALRGAVAAIDGGPGRGRRGAAGAGPIRLLRHLLEDHRRPTRRRARVRSSRASPSAPRRSWRTCRTGVRSVRC